MKKFKTPIILLLLLTACQPQPDIDISTTITKAHDYFRQIDQVETTAAAFDGDNEVKFRIMVEGTPTEEEATALFYEILDRFKEFANEQTIWDDYHGYFDIMNDDGVLFEATKLMGKELAVESK